MLSTLAIVQLPSQSGSRIPRPHFRSLAQRSFGGKSLLEWILRRVTDSLQLDGVIAVVDESPEGRRVSQLVPPDVPVFISEKPDSLARLADAVREYQAETFVRVSADNPFVDPELIDRLIISARSGPECDYVGYGNGGGRSAVGLFAEWCRAESIKRADRKAKDPADRRDAMGYLTGNPDLFKLRLLPIPEALDRDDLRLTIQGEEDWEHAQTIYDALGPESLDWQRIAGLLDHQPALRQRMADLNRENANV